MGLVLSQHGVGSHLHGRNESTEGRSATCGEQYDMASAGSQCRRRYEVVARSREQVQTRVLQAVAILHDTADGSLTTFLCASQRLVLEGRDTTGLVAW